MLHELTHFTSAPNRCNRQLGKRFGDQAYAMEELVAELGAAFLCADLGITDVPRGSRAVSGDVAFGSQSRQEGDLHGSLEASEAAGFLAALQGV